MTFACIFIVGLTYGVQFWSLHCKKADAYYLKPNSVITLPARHGQFPLAVQWRSSPKIQKEDWHQPDRTEWDCQVLPHLRPCMGGDWGEYNLLLQVEKISGNVC